MRTYPAVAEAEARGATAALFAEIRLALGVPLVNLVWRHLATLPGGLEWAWGTVRPYYRSGAAARDGAALLAALPLTDATGWSREQLRAAAVDDAAEGTVRRILDSYNRSNAMNLVALTALTRRVAEGPARRHILRPADDAPGDASASAEALPSLLTPAEMAPPTAALVARLDRLGESEEGRIPASMYRQLAHWPGFLALAAARLEPLHADGRLDGLITVARRLAGTGATRAVHALVSSAPPPAPPTAAAVRAALDEFTSTVIAKMVPICAVLRRAMPE